jgi:hypothetical protein
MTLPQYHQNALMAVENALELLLGLRIRSNLGELDESAWRFSKDFGGY